MHWIHQFQNCLSTNGKSCPMWSRKKLSQDHPVTQIQSEARLWWRFRGWRQKSWDELGTPAWLWQMNFMGVFYYSGFPAPKHTSHPFAYELLVTCLASTIESLFCSHVQTLESTEMSQNQSPPSRKLQPMQASLFYFTVYFQLLDSLISCPILSVATLGTEYC